MQHCVICFPAFWAKLQPLADQVVTSAADIQWEGSWKPQQFEEQQDIGTVSSLDWFLQVLFCQSHLIDLI